MTRDPAELASTYFDAWQARDEQALAEVLAQDVTFRGPLGTAIGRKHCIAGLLGMLGIVTNNVADGRIARIQVACDLREILANRS